MYVGHLPSANKNIGKCQQEVLKPWLVEVQGDMKLEAAMLMHCQHENVIDLYTWCPGLLLMKLMDTTLYNVLGDLDAKSGAKIMLQVSKELVC